MTRKVTEQKFQKSRSQMISWSFHCRLSCCLQTVHGRELSLSVGIHCHFSISSDRQWRQTLSDTAFKYLRNNNRSSCHLHYPFPVWFFMEPHYLNLSTINIFAVFHSTQECSDLPVPSVLLPNLNTLPILFSFQFLPFGSPFPGSLPKHLN